MFAHGARHTNYRLPVPERSSEETGQKIGKKMKVSTMSNQQPGQNAPPTGGFLASLHGANIGDLVQMECLSLSHRVARIVTSDDIGYLYFSGGQIVHAETAHHDGEAAAMEILSWDDGTFEPWTREWPKEETILSSWQSLLMRAVHARDERNAREAALQVVPFPNENSMSTTSTNEFETVAGDVEIAARLSPDGEILASLGASEEFASIAAYAGQLAQLIGASLGMSGFSEMEFDFKSSKCLIVVDRDGNILAFKPKGDVTTGKLREKLKL